MTMIITIFILLGSLFAMPFLASSSKDTEIKNSAAMMATAIQEFAANNNGRMPNGMEFEQLVRHGVYVDSLKGGPYGADNYFPGERCDGTQNVRAFSVKVKLTDASDYCIDD